MTVGGRTSIVQEAVAGLQRISRAAWLVSLAAVTASAAVEVVLWSQHRQSGWADAAPGAVIATGWVAAIYVGALAIIARRPTVAGFGRFALATLAGFAPLVLGLAILLAARPWLGEGPRLAIFLVAMAVQFSFTAILPAWPVTQALSTTIVSPLRVLSATRGHRWSLVVATFVIGALNNDHLVPKMATATSIGTACAIAVADMVIGLLTIGFTAAIAATAWQFAVRNDPGLA